MGNPALERLKAQKSKPTIITRTIPITPAAARPPSSQLSSTAVSKRHVVVAQKRPRLANSINGHTSRSASSSSRPPPPIKESRNPTKHARPQTAKAASPAVMTPTFTSSSDDNSEVEEHTTKRRRLNRRGSVDVKRRIRDVDSFADDSKQTFPMVHAADIANSDIVEHNRTKYTTFFTALQGDEDDEPMIELQYPGASQRERYQLVRPTDASDFKPLSEIMDNMKVVAEYYLSESDALRLYDETDGSGLVAKLDHAAKQGRRQRVGAQTDFIRVVAEYNTFLSHLRQSGAIAGILDELQSIPLRLVEHIVKNQVYARTVSPQVHLVRAYESFSDNVYGELLPKFLSEIFIQTHLKSDQVFVDLGSGVGNCVLQAALEVGCESWGCEIMENPSKLAQLQAVEFPARCRMWGIRPGDVHLLQDDFMTNKRINEVLPRADVVLINNQAFTAELNDKLKYKFLDLKEGCQIVSLKPFKDPGQVIKETNINDPVNILTVERKDRFSGHVSWTDDPGSWYLQRKDSRGLEKFMKRLNS